MVRPYFDTRSGKKYLKRDHLLKIFQSEILTTQHSESLLTRTKTFVRDTKHVLFKQNIRIHRYFDIEDIFQEYSAIYNLQIYDTNYRYYEKEDIIRVLETYLLRSPGYANLPEHKKKLEVEYFMILLRLTLINYNYTYILGIGPARDILSEYIAKNGFHPLETAEPNIPFECYIDNMYKHKLPGKIDIPSDDYYETYQDFYKKLNEYRTSFWYRLKN